MQGVFINYRRDDASGYARLLFERLAREFGEDQVFMDVEALREPGMDFVEAIEGSVGNCAALLALIGKNWLTSEDRQGRKRLDNPDDFVRAEIAAALGRNTRVIPVLVQGARMPETEELPDDLAPLARRQALKLSHDDWEHHVGKLIQALEKLPGCTRIKPAASNATQTASVVTPTKSAAPKVAAAIAATVVITIGLLYWIGSSVESTDPGRSEFTGPDTRQTLLSETQDSTSGTDTTSTRETVAPDADVKFIQETLLALGYDPGPADGLMGPGTIGAIREFQSDEGLAVTGTVTPQLVTAVADAALQDFDDTVSGSASMAGMNLTGTWYDDNSIPIYLEHTGTIVRVGEFNVMMQQFMPIGSGTLQNGRLELQYTNSLGQSGTVVAQLSADGRHLNGTDTVMATGYTIQNTWHYEHLPGQ